MDGADIMSGIIADGNHRDDHLEPGLLCSDPTARSLLTKSKFFSHPIRIISALARMPLSALRRIELQIQRINTLLKSEIRCNAASHGLPETVTETWKPCAVSVSSHPQHTMKNAGDLNSRAARKI
jgi:hypothetical protein